MSNTVITNNARDFKYLTVLGVFVSDEPGEAPYQGVVVRGVAVRGGAAGAAAAARHAARARAAHAARARRHRARAVRRHLHGTTLVVV